MSNRRSSRSGRFNYYKESDYYFTCQRCGVITKISHIKKEWTGLWVCDETVHDCWEERHPQDFVRGIPEHMQVFPASPLSPLFVPTYIPTVLDNICGRAICGLSTCGFTPWNPG